MGGGGGAYPPTITISMYTVFTLASLYCILLVKGQLTLCMKICCTNTQVSPVYSRSLIARMKKTVAQMKPGSPVDQSGSPVAQMKPGSLVDQSGSPVAQMKLGSLVDQMKKLGVQ